MSDLPNQIRDEAERRVVAVRDIEQLLLVFYERFKVFLFASEQAAKLQTAMNINNQHEREMDMLAAFHKYVRSVVKREMELLQQEKKG